MPLSIGRDAVGRRRMALHQPTFGKLCGAQHSLLNVDFFDMWSRTAPSQENGGYQSC